MGMIESDKVLEEIALLLNEGKQVLFTPRGVSMRPFIEGGKDTVTLVKKPTVAVGDIILVHIADRYILHRVYKLSDPKTSSPLGGGKEGASVITLQGDGNLQGYEQCTPEDVLGTVTAIQSPKGRRKPLTKGRLWRLLKPFRKYLLKIYRHTYLTFNY